MGKLIHICLGMILAPVLYGQSAASFEAKIPPSETNVPKKDEKAAVPVQKEAGPVVATPSRYIGPGELEQYLLSQSSVFSAAGRTRDPFGQLQDPDAKPIVKNTGSKTNRRAPAVQITPFSDIVRLIEINAVLPGEQKFLIRERSFKVGDQIPLNFRSKTFRVQIIQVSAKQIGFRNLDTGDEAVRKLDVLPVGMIPGRNGKIAAPGMVPDHEDAPIILDSTEAPPSSP